MEMTLTYAEAHFSQLLQLVAKGEEVVLRNESEPVARIVPIPSTAGTRPRVGTLTSGPVSWTEDCFAPLDDAGMKELGLL
jgi:prevent-host-death family protein